MSKEGKKNFDFINEHIKKKPFYKRKWFITSSAAIGLALVFGAVAGLVFAIVTPWAKSNFGEPEKMTQIVITQETENTTERPNENSTKGSKDKESETKATEKHSEENLPQSVVENKELDISDYKRIHSLMSAVANRASRSIVTVIGSTSNVNWFNEESENHVQASGMIIADNGTYMYILTETQVTDGAERLRITFGDNSTVDAVMQSQDSLTGLALLRVPSNKIKSETRESIEIAAFSNSSSITQGNPVIAIGSPLGHRDAMSFGMVTSINPASVDDREYNMIATDIIGSEDGSGILVDLDGKIVGIITKNFTEQQDQLTLTALPAQELLKLVENLTNNVEMAYMGIIGKNVTPSVMEELNLPAGIYIKEAVGDSPAMYAGIQTADIMVAINDTNLKSMKDFQKKLQTLHPGEVVEVTLMRQGMDGGYSEIMRDVTLGVVQ